MGNRFYLAVVGAKSQAFLRISRSPMSVGNGKHLDTLFRLAINHGKRESSQHKFAGGAFASGPAVRGLDHKIQRTIQFGGEIDAAAWFRSWYHGTADFSSAGASA